MKNSKGQFLKGHQPTEAESIKKSVSLKKSWRLRNDFHGLYGSKIHNTWRSMKGRCNGSFESGRKKYHDKGIVYCERWGSFKLFLEDMQSTYIDGYQLDRIDNSKGYSKENCRWVTAKQNCNNKSNNVIIEYLGEKKTLSQWADHFNKPYPIFRQWYYRAKRSANYSFDKMIFTKITYKYQDAVT